MSNGDTTIIEAEADTVEVGEREHQTCATDLFFEIAERLAAAQSESALERALEICARNLGASHIVLGVQDASVPVSLCRWSPHQFALGQIRIDGSPALSTLFGGGVQTSDDPALRTALFGENGNPGLTVIGSSPDCEPGFMALAGVRNLQGVPHGPILHNIVGLLLAAARAGLRRRATQSRIEKLNNVLSFSDSVYSSWHIEDGWHYHNVNSIVELGYERDQIDVLAEASKNPMHPEDWKLGARLFEKTLKSGLGYQHDYRAVGPGGDLRWYRAEVTVTRQAPGGGTHELVSISRNITGIRMAARKAVEKANLEKWLVAKVNSIFSCDDFEAMKPVLREVGSYLGIDRCTIRVVDPETRRCNLAGEWWRRGLQSLTELYPELSSLSGVGWVGQLVALGNTYVVANVARQPMDERLRERYQSIGVEAVVTHPMIHENQLTGYLSLMSNTERQWTEAELRVAREITNAVHMTVLRARLLDELRANDERFQLAMESSTYGLWDQDCVADTIYYSPHFYERLGYPRRNRAIPLEKILRYIHPDDHHHLFRQQRLEQETDTIDLELRHVKKDGSLIWMMSRGKVVERDQAGHALRLVGVNIDISEQKAMLAELHEARQIAEEANRSKSEFLERMSHEIRTPMNAIMGMAYLALDAAMDTKQRGFMEDIDAAAKSLLHIIDDILDFTLIEAGELSIVSERFNLREELERTVKLMQTRATQGGNQLQLQMADDLPRYLLGDKHRLGQVLTNLLSNALKFTTGGTVRLEARLAGKDPHTETRRLHFSVQDSGIGLSKEQIARVFEPFTQAEDSTTRKYGGTGLGLAICQHLVTIMGGSIQCRSEPGQGTTFEFTTVFKQDPTENGTKHLHDGEDSLQSLAQWDRTFEGRRVLLVEDNAVNQRVALGILHKLGSETSTATNGAEALDLLDAVEPGHFDAVLMDIEMPVLDGMEATRRIRRQSRFHSLPIIAMTAHAMRGDRERCMAAGMNEHVAKPVNPRKLARVLSEIWMAPGDGER
ncbi:ATP-binding protein [Gilvimarinus sp. F26214L]|uniref:ATP-binding protein n=1 Tax=Gilvimarinus sp. DZF01 TaxID=3461371 RepID=UPI0040461F73